LKPLRGFIDALQAAEAAGRELVALRAGAAQSVGAARDLVREFDLQMRVAEAPALVGHQAQLAINLAAALTDLAAGDAPRDFVEAYLATARSEYQRVAAVG
jgi:hypothetical protein